MTENKVFYGEYSLKHWIDLILKKDIEIPEYQRSFVWEKKDIQEFIKSIEDGNFVPPVTIGHIIENEQHKNIIIDGQQRLTSIFLAYLGYFPEEKSNSIEETTTDEDDVNLDLDLANQEVEKKGIKWTLKELTSLGKNISEIKREIPSNYKPFNINTEINEEFLKKNFLGFSYIVPHKKTDISKYFSTVFRNINSKGTPLSRLESRESLYYLDKDLTNLFSPNFMDEFSVNNNKIDFVRILAFLSQYKNNEESTNRLARGYTRNGRGFESYYEDYVYHITQKNTEIFGDLIGLIGNNEEIKRRLEILKLRLHELEIPREYPSIIYQDLVMFGLVYKILFKNEPINIKIRTNLQETKIKEKAVEIGQDPKLTKSPNTLARIKERIKTSIDIYNEVFE